MQQETLNLSHETEELAVDAGLQAVTSSQLLQDVVGSPRPDEMYVVAVGKTIKFEVKVRDRNVEDVVDIMVSV